MEDVAQTAVEACICEGTFHVTEFRRIDVHMKRISECMVLA